MAALMFAVPLRTFVGNSLPRAVQIGRALRTAMGMVKLATLKLHAEVMLLLACVGTKQF
jgi:hypothetical protein